MKYRSEAYDRESDTHAGGFSDSARVTWIGGGREMKQVSGEDVIDSPSMVEGRRTNSEKWPRQRFWLFRLGLFVFDFLAIFCSFLLIQQFVGSPFEGNAAESWEYWPLLFVFLTLTFFPSAELYSYHLIFSRQKHSKSMIRALSLASASIVIVMGYYLLPQIAKIWLAQY